MMVNNSSGVDLNGRILHLTLKKRWFDLMVAGKKKVEYRQSSRWIISRLEKEYDVIKFTNGYGSDKPYFFCQYNGFEISKKKMSKILSDVRYLAFESIDRHDRRCSSIW